MNVAASIVLALAVVFSYVWAEDKLMRSEQDALETIFKGYDSRIRPSGKNGSGPVVVRVNTYVRSFDVDDTKMMFNVQLIFRMQWTDERLKYNTTPVNYMTLTDPSKMWIPDIFFSNEMRGHYHNILTPNILIRIYPDGEVLFSTRISLELQAPMDLRRFPMDNQVVSIIAASYGYTTHDIVFVWKDVDPVQITKVFVTPVFSLIGFGTDYCNSRTITGDYSCIKAFFHFSREFTYYLLRAYMPTIFLVILSWITFWMDPRAIVTRLGLWIAVLVSLIIVNSSVTDSGPQVSYIKALDVWMGACLTFVFCALVEMGLVSNAAMKNNRLSLKNQMELEETMNEKGMDDDDGMKDSSHRPKIYTITPLRWLNKYPTQAQRIDVISRFLFPAAFVFFNLVYWLTYRSE